MDVVYLVRPGNDNPELRYSLRSVWRNLQPDRVWIAGHCPPWVAGVRRLTVAQLDPTRYKRQNAIAILYAVAAAGPDEFVLFNDDFFVTHPVAGPPPPVHRGPLADFAADRLAAKPDSPYSGLLARTDEALRAAGVRRPLAYETHTPMAMSREQLRVTLGFIETENAPPEQLAPRSILGNLHALGGERIGDVKVYGAENAPAAAGPWLSTTDSSFRYHPIGQKIRRAFSDPSPYELS